MLTNSNFGLNQTVVPSPHVLACGNYHETTWEIPCQTDAAHSATQEPQTPNNSNDIGITHKDHREFFYRRSNFP